MPLTSSLRPWLTCVLVSSPRLSRPMSSSSMFSGQLKRGQGEDDNGKEAKVLWVTCCHSESSLASLAAKQLIEELRWLITRDRCLAPFVNYKILRRFDHDVIKRDLWRDDLVSYNISHVAAKMRLIKGNGSEEDEELFEPVRQVILEKRKVNVYFELLFVILTHSS